MTDRDYDRYYERRRRRKHPVKRFIKKVIMFIVIALFAGVLINMETDLFSSLELYAPEFCEKHPEINQRIKDISLRVSAVTDRIPSFAEIAAIISNEEPPVDPTDVATNAYIENSPMLTFYPEENIGALMENGKLSVFGVTDDRDKSHFIVNINTLAGEELSRTLFGADSGGTFSKTIEIPETDEDVLGVSVYTGKKQFGEYRSWIYNYLYLKRENGNWIVDTRSPVYQNNLDFYRRDKSRTEALKSTQSIQSNDPSVISIANEIVKNCDTDYERALAIHDWVSEYLYYDRDHINSGSAEALPYSAIEVIASKRAVCLGYATLYASLCQAVNIPCNVVLGYALGVGEDLQWTDTTVNTDVQNHAWNEVYADGRWVIVDTTWDSPNVYENGEFVKGESVSHIYFDANIDFFSNNHKILEYSRKR